MNIVFTLSSKFSLKNVSYLRTSTKKRAQGRTDLTFRHDFRQNIVDWRKLEFHLSYHYRQVQNQLKLFVYFSNHLLRFETLPNNFQASSHCELRWPD